MKVFLNIIWYFPFFGFVFAFFTAIGGLLMCLTIVGLPLGLGLLQIAKFLLAPHTYELVSQKELSAAKGEERNQLWVIFSTIVRILYFPIGLVLAVVYFFTAILNFISLIGIPNGIVYVKLIPAVFNPVGKVCVGGAIARKLKADKDQAKVDNYFGTPRPSASTTDNVMPQNHNNELPQTENPRFFTDEKIADILKSPTLYREELVESCRKEKEIRDNIESVMPEIEAMPMEKIYEIVNSKSVYSAVVERCAQIIIKKEDERIEAEMEEIRQREEAERQAAEEAERQRRQEQIDEALRFLNKWKFVIGGAVIAIIALSIVLWITSDSHRFNVGADAAEKNDYNSVIEMMSKIDDPDSKYYQPALIMGLNAVTEADGNLSDKTKEQGEILQNRLDKFVETTEFNDKNFLVHCYYWHQVYDNIDKSVPEGGDSTVCADWLRIARAYENADVTGNEYYTDLLNFGAAYAYFMHSDFNDAKRLFDKVADSDIQYIKEYASGYLGLINLFNVCENPCSREDAFALLRKAPIEGMFAFYRGIAELANHGYTLKNRLTEAQTCFTNAYLPDTGSGKTDENITALINGCRNIVGKLIDTSVWNYYGYIYGTGNKGRYTGPTKSIGFNTGANGWGVFNYSYENISYGLYDYVGQTNIVGNPELTIYYKDRWIYFFKGDDMREGTTTGGIIINRFQNNANLGSFDISLMDLYGCPFSPIYNVSKYNKMIEEYRKSMEDFE